MASCLRSCRKLSCQHSESKHRILTVLAISTDVVRFRFTDRITHNPCASHGFARSRLLAWVFQSTPVCSDVCTMVATVLFRFGARRSSSPAFVIQTPSRPLSLGQCSPRREIVPARVSRIRQGGFEMTSATARTKLAAQALKQTIVEKAAGTSNGLEATDDQRDAIAEAINELVALNPTEDITTSDVATGTWDLVYTTTTGASGGKLGPFVGSVQQEVDIAGDVYINYVRVGPLTGKLDATWEVLNKRQWKVIFKTIAFSLWGQQLIKRDLAQEGLWTLSYLDEDFRVLTARSLERETGNLYVLGRS